LSLLHIPIPENYFVFIDWKFESIPLVTDRRGWVYKINFEKIHTTPVQTNETQVRYRKWERILIDKNSFANAQHRLSQFLKYQNQFRSLCPSLLKAALHKFNFHFQFVMESERLIEHSSSSLSHSNSSSPLFSSTALLPYDPPHWSIGPEMNLTCDPRLYPIDDLQHTRATLLSQRIENWEPLHHFTPILYPNKDTEGWEYNLDFQEEDIPWSSFLHIGTTMKVRRRVWIRSCVRSEWLYKCRHTLTEYLNLHPRGVCYMSPIEIYLPQGDGGSGVGGGSGIKTRGRGGGTNANLTSGREEDEGGGGGGEGGGGEEEGQWHRCIGVIKDHSLELKFMDKNKRRLKYDLRLTEIHEPPPISSSSSSSSSSYQMKTISFSLVKKGSNGSDLGSICQLRTHTSHETNSWIIQLLSQLTLIHICCSDYPLHSYGPPISDQVVIEGHMWKRGHFVPNWKFRTFQLRESGALTYYHHQQLKGRLQLRHCEIIDSTTDIYCSFSLLVTTTKSTMNKSQYQLFLRTTDRKTKMQWMAGMSLFCGKNNMTRVGSGGSGSGGGGGLMKKIKFPNKGPLYSFENIYHESQGRYHKKYQQVDVRDEMGSQRSYSINDDESMARSCSSSTSSSVISSNPTRGLQPTKSAMKSSRRLTDGPEDVTVRDGDQKMRSLNSTPTLGPMSEANHRYSQYFSSDKDSPSLTSYMTPMERDLKPPATTTTVVTLGSASHVDQNIQIAEVEDDDDDDDDDEVDTSAFYGLEEEEEIIPEVVPTLSPQQDDLDTVWDDDDDDDNENEQSEKDATRKSSFSVVSNLKDFLGDHRDSVALMKLMGLSDDHEVKPREDSR
jgi:hypothetical protein